MPDYQKGKIYKLWSPSKNLVYYGSTTQSISQRLTDHIKRKNNNNERQYTSNIILDCEDYKIELIEEYSCNNRQQLERKEGEYIKANECVNKYVAGRTDREWREDNREYLLNYDRERAKKRDKQKEKERKDTYRKNNPEKVKECQKKWNEKNKEKLKAKDKKYKETKKQNNLIYKWLLMTGIIV
jgi:hypothetical protein